jgi:hypothetical protein
MSALRTSKKNVEEEEEKEKGEKNIDLVLLIKCFVSN